MQNKARAHLALLGTNVFFAINYTAVKYLINEGLVKPFGLNLIRVGITTILLWIIYFARQQHIIIHTRHLLRFSLCALTGIGINQLLFIKGLSLTYSIHASLLMLTTPILITFIAAWFLKERLNGFTVTGLVLGITGALILISSRRQAGNPGNVLLGDIFIIINAVSYAIYFLLVKPLMKEYSPVSVIRMMFTIGFFMILPFCWREFRQTPWQSYDAIEYCLLALIVLGGTFLAYLFNVYGIKVLGASKAGAYIYSQPFFAAAIAMIFLGEQLSFYKIIAAGFIFAGVYLANKTNIKRA